LCRRTRIVEHVDRACLSVGELSRLGDDGRQDGFEVDGRIDRLADLAERLQLSDRLREFARACLHLVEQPHVFDRDQRLIGEGSHQLNLLFRERSGGAPRHHENTDRVSFAQHRDTQDGAKTADLLSLGCSVFSIDQHVGNVNSFAFEQRASDQSSPFRLKRIRLHVVEPPRREAIACSMIVRFARTSLARHGNHIRFAKLRSGLDKCVEYRLQIEGRAADDLEHVGGGGLLLQRFAQLVEQARVLDGDDGLAGEILH
jgi:hypothetical protein